MAALSGVVRDFNAAREALNEAQAHVTSAQAPLIHADQQALYQLASWRLENVTALVERLTAWVESQAAEIH